MAFFWQPTYYVEVYSGALQNASLYSTLPWVASAVFTNMAGWVADLLIARSALTLTAVRKLMEAVSCFGAAACLLAMAFLPKVDFNTRHRACVPCSRLVCRFNNITCACDRSEAHMQLQRLA